LAELGWKLAALARRYNLDSSHVSRLVRRIAWADIE